MKTLITLASLLFISTSVSAGDIIVGQKKAMESDPSLFLVTMTIKDNIKIENIVVNRNPKCDLKIGETEQEYMARISMGALPIPKWNPVKYPIDAPFGSKFGAVSPCNPIEIVVKTNKGDKTIEWSN